LENGESILDGNVVYSPRANTHAPSLIFLMY